MAILGRLLVVVILILVVMKLSRFIKWVFNKKSIISKERRISEAMKMPDGEQKFKILAEEWAPEVGLDFSSKSLLALDEYSTKLREQTASDPTQRKALGNGFLRGCYFGEVVARNLGTKWFFKPDDVGVRWGWVVGRESGFLNVFKIAGDSVDDDSRFALCYKMAEQKLFVPPKKDKKAKQKPKNKS